MSRQFCRPGCLIAFAALLPPQPLHAQIEVGELVRKNELMFTLPPDSLYEQPRELVRAASGRLSTMTARVVEGEVRGGRLQHREAFVALHTRPRLSYEVYDRGSVAIREDSLFRVLYVAEMDPGLGYVARLETLIPPGSPSQMHFLHVRYVQTGTGNVTEDLVFALDANDRLVEVPIVHPDLDHLLEEGEYLCCGRFTSFDEHLVEFTVYVTRDGRRGITHKVRSSFRLEGRFELDAETDQYVPRFLLVTEKTTGQEPQSGGGF